jgi:hypothetical protein
LTHFYNAVGDKFCADIESNGSRLEDLHKLVTQHDTELKENSAALKDITKVRI